MLPKKLLGALAGLLSGNDILDLSGTLSRLPGLPNRPDKAPGSEPAAAAAPPSRPWPYVADPAPARAPPPQGINCDLLLRGGYLSCGRAGPRVCDLLSWLHAGCKKQPECAGKVGEEAKQCCEDRHTIPFGGGLSYTGYMRACAPQYALRRLDRPALLDMPCRPDFTSAYWMNYYMAKLIRWQNHGCRQRERCAEKAGHDAAALAACCDGGQDKPEGIFAPLYQLAYDVKCRNLAPGSRANSTKGLLRPRAPALALGAADE